MKVPLRMTRIAQSHSQRRASDPTVVPIRTRAQRYVASIETKSALPDIALTRTRGGTFSPTTDVIYLSDGRTARTDLIRLTPNVDAYSLDFNGISPRQLAHYRPDHWQRGASATATSNRAQISTIVAKSFPHVALDVLSGKLRRAGCEIGVADLKDHEAIAATQAAIWKLSNGLELDAQSLAQPVRARSRQAGAAFDVAIGSHHEGIDWNFSASTAGVSYLELELPGAPELRSYGWRLPRSVEHARLRVWLERSNDAVSWTKVKASDSIIEGAARLRPTRFVKNLGVGSTLSTAAGDPGHTGYRYYRIAVESASGIPQNLYLGGVHVHIAGVSPRRNSERVHALYEYLLATADTTAHPSAWVRSSDIAPTAQVLVGSATPRGERAFTPLIAMLNLPASERPEETSKWPIPAAIAEAVPG